MSMLPFRIILRQAARVPASVVVAGSGVAIVALVVAIVRAAGGLGFAGLTLFALSLALLVEGMR